MRTAVSSRLKNVSGDCRKGLDRIITAASLQRRSVSKRLDCFRQASWVSSCTLLPDLRTMGEAGAMCVRAHAWWQGKARTVAV